MRWYMSGEPAAERLEEQPHIERGDHERHHIREQLEPRGVRKLAHLHPIGGEQHEGKNRERELETENDLAQYEELGCPALTVQDGDDGGGHNGDGAGNEASQPWTDADVEEALHHDLAGERP